MTVSVINIRTLSLDDNGHYVLPSNYFYIGRTCKQYGLAESVFANRYIINIHGNRQQVIDMYRRSVTPRLAAMMRRELENAEALVCWCKPLACHGDVIAELLR